MVAALSVWVAVVMGAQISVWGGEVVESGVASSEFPTPTDNEPLAATNPLPGPEDSARAIELPAGFTATVFASEPDVRNPIDMAWDHLGRMWVAENYTYADRTQKFDEGLRDRVVVFQDADQDGTPERRSVFLDSVSKLTSVEVGRGGVWLMCPPRLLFVPDADHDAVPDGPPETVLDGFTVANQNYHNFANGLRFGPDGWLYGRCGGSCPGTVGSPGTPDEDRIALEGGVWRYNVDEKRFEVICHGTTNPWGHDFNEIGELFFINTVNGHLWHGIHGAHFKRPFTLDPNLDAYELIDQHADHFHFDTTGNWTASRDGAANDFGGGHAHSGMMIYQETLWPAKLRGALMTLNFHGRRANVEHLHREGTGYVGKHGVDFFVSGDEWFRGMEISAGPDGNCYVLDWSDLGECHEHTGVHRNSGRIFKIQANSTGEQAGSTNVSLSEETRSTVAKRLSVLAGDDAVALARFQLGNERWFSHQSRMRLVELNRLGKLSDSDRQAVLDLLKEAIQSERSAAELARCFWTLADLDPQFDGRQWLFHSSPVLRGITLRYLTQDWPIDDCYGPTADSRLAWSRIRPAAIQLIADMDKLGLPDAPALRLIVASTLQRLPSDLRAGAAARLLAITGDADANDHNQAKLIWYGIMGRIAQHPAESLSVLKACQLPELTGLVARSLGEQFGEVPDVIVQALAISGDGPWCGALLEGLLKGSVGLRATEEPQSWAVFRSRTVRFDPGREALCKQLEVKFGDGIPASELADMVGDRKRDIQDRLTALVGWVRSWQDQVAGGQAADGGRAGEAGEIIKAAEPLIGDARVNLAAARAITLIPDSRVATQLIRQYRRFRAPVRPQVISMLCVRVEYANELMNAIEGGKLPVKVLSAANVRDLLALGDSELAERVEAKWGRLTSTPQDRLDEIERLRGVLSPSVLAKANASIGRDLFDRNCSTCHRMFGTGENVGPDLTGAQRTSLDYWLHHVVDPDAVVGADYRARKILTLDGRLLVGLVTQRTRSTLTLASANRTQTIPLDEIEAEFETDQSPMPSGLLKPLDDQGVANLIAYLMSPVQVQRNSQ
ncbi:putative membrane-bound dehydrogenase domain-containing protein [Neorhodopirellula lusitana]|uniref:Membrane-bound dehydrogenase domain-containing protein n=1 Tax=Neorhodopirellula lusitana TaxID=445327 RepID=A0ABY1Q0S9_9BACT|nr:PVC-type heme-binding CxxCH protein [Neorhodopirellula lusitana]SMP53813.1 putative membrane-bound dehydrogenase domain-containing protein [Neorhodopirellula lusitana]